MLNSRRVEAGNRFVSTLLVAALISTFLALTASPASAVGLTISPQRGPAGTRVTVTVSNLDAPCQVFFDATLVVSAASCQPGAEGSVTTSFTVPGAATAGSHQVRVTDAESGGSSSVSVTFTVGSSAPPPPPPAPRPPAAAPPPPAPAPPAPAPPPPAAAPRPPAPAPAPPAASPTASPSPTPAATPTAAGACDIQPSAVESLTVSPESGSGGSTATVEVDWSPDAGEDCPDPVAQLRVNGEEAGSPIPVGGDPVEVEIEIPEEVTGDIPVTLVAADGDANVLASTQFEVDEDGGSDVSSWLLVAALVVATLVGIAVQRLSRRRRARYGGG